MLRQVLHKQLPCAIQNYGRFMSTAPAKDLVLVDVSDKTGYATLTLNRPPVNSLNGELLTAISTKLDELAANKTRGLILTSSSSTVFSAGLDITELYKPTPERLKFFWSALQDVWLKLYGSSYPTVAAINGHAPAGGCLLALSCEYRIMVPNFTIGLNETQLGIVAPQWFIASMENVLSRRHTENALTQGRMFTSAEALQIGLVDELAVGKAEALAKAETFLNRFARIPAEARAITKFQFRKKDIQALEENREQDLQILNVFVNSPKVQKGLELYLQSLKGKK